MSISQKSELSIIENAEGERLERCAQLSPQQKDKFCKCLCAFANDLGESRKTAYFLFGLEDKSGQRIGLKVDDQSQRMVAQWVDSGPSPYISTNLEYDGDAAGDLLIVSVEPSKTPPHRYKGEIWVRRGPQTVRANKEDELRLASKGSHYASMSFDAAPLPEAGLRHLAMDMFAVYRGEVLSAEAIAANDRKPEEQWAALNLYDLEKNCPKRAALIAFPHRQQVESYFPHAYIQLVHTKNTDLTELNAITQKQKIKSDFRDMINRIGSIIGGYNTGALHQNGWQTVPNPEYPEWALRELVINAMIHRDYELPAPIHVFWYANRIEIQSPGNLPYPVTQKNIGKTKSTCRNPILASVMQGWGYIEQCGTGISRVRNLLKKNGNLPLELEEEEGYFVARVWAKSAQETRTALWDYDELTSAIVELQRALERAQGQFDRQAYAAAMQELGYLYEDVKEAENLSNPSPALIRRIDHGWSQCDDLIRSLPPFSQVTAALDEVARWMRKG